MLANDDNKNIYIQNNVIIMVIYHLFIKYGLYESNT